MTDTSTCVLRSGTKVVLGPCTGASDTKWHFATDGVNFGPVKHQVRHCKDHRCGSTQGVCRTKAALGAQWALQQALTPKCQQRFAQMSSWHLLRSQLFLIVSPQRCTAIGTPCR